MRKIIISIVLALLIIILMAVIRSLIDYFFNYKIHEFSLGWVSGAIYTELTTYILKK